jgi:hypothetical protein
VATTRSFINCGIYLLQLLFLSGGSQIKSTGRKLAPQTSQGSTGESFFHDSAIMIKDPA